MEKIAIVGAGLVGSLQAILMAKRGYDVHIYEYRPDLRDIELLGGKSINLALSDRGWKALEMADIADEIREISIPMYGRKMHAVDGTLTDQPYGKEGQAIYSVSRGDLNKRMLLLASKYDNVSFHFNHKCLDVDLESNKMTFLNTATNEKVEAHADRIFGTDGAFSAVRKKMMRMDRFNYSQEYLRHGYKELLLPANEDGTHKLDKNCLHIWPRGEYMLIALPNLDGSYTCTLFFPFEGETSFESLKTNADVDQFFSTVFPDFFAIMPEVADEYFSNQSSSLAIIRCEPWNYKGQIQLMGDACHAIVPFYGQGMNSGFEDCSIFNEMIENEKDWDKLFHEFSTLRKPDGDAIADLAVHNYYVMRDFVGDEMFLLRKKIEKKIYEKHPGKWMPLYSQVTFSHIRYSEALAAGKRQDKIMDKVMELPDIKNSWDSEEVEQMIINML